MAFISTWPQVPSAIPQGRDSGIYSYISLMAEQGATLYTEVWADNKPPVLYYINALAFALFGAGRWSLWFLGLFIHLINVALVFGVLRVLYRRPAIALTGATVYAVLARHPALVIDGNLTESYALLPQAFTMAAGYWFLRRPSAPLALVIGLSACAAFLTRQTAIGAAAMFIPAILAVRHPVLYQRRLWLWLALMVVGGLSGLALLGLHLLAAGSLSVALDAMINVPFEFHQWVDRTFTPAWATIFTTFTSGNFWLGLGVFLPYVVIASILAVQHPVQALSPRRPSGLILSPTLRTWEVWIALTFVADLALANTTNKSHGHYYLTPTLALAFMVAAGLAALFRAPPRSRRARYGRHIYWAGALLLVAVIELTSFWIVATLPGSSFRGPARHHPWAEYVASNTAPEESVYGWGVWSSMINFQAMRKSPTRFHYGYPLIVPGDGSEERIAQTVEDLERNRPTLIIDTTWVDGRRVPPIDPERRIAWWARGGRRDVANLQPIFHFIGEHCEQVDEVEDADVYRCAYGGEEPGPAQVFVPTLDP